MVAGNTDELILSWAISAFQVKASDGFWLRMIAHACFWLFLPHPLVGHLRILDQCVPPDPPDG